MIYCWTGTVGQGKSVSLKHELQKRFRAEMCQVYTDMQFLKVPHACYFDTDDPRALAKCSNGIVVLDEGQVLFSSRYWRETDKTVLSAMAQSRKNGLDLFVTTQHMDRLEPALRELVGVEIRCRKVGPIIMQFHYPAGIPKVKPFKRTFFRLTADVVRDYDTLEVIGSKMGQGYGRSSELDAARRRRRRAARRPGLVVKPEFTGPLYVASFGGGRNCLYLRPGYELAKRSFVRVVGRTPSGDELREWARRSAWLGRWGLRPEDLPAECTPAHWWMPGGSPLEIVTERAGSLVEAAYA